MTAPAVDPAEAGERIERLLEASAAAGPVARERSEELVRLVVELYGAGLERLMELAHEQGALSDELLAALAGDELVSGLLLVHGLHPYGVEDRIEQALEDVRPYLGSHGGDVRLIEVTDDGVVRLELLGSCDGCASSAVTLELAVEEAIRAAAPETLSIEVIESAGSPAATGNVIPVDALSARLRAAEQTGGGGVVWTSAGPLDDLAVGSTQQITIEGVDLLLCRLTSGVYAYRDSCSSCSASLADSGLQRSPATPGSAVLTCRACGAHFDIRRAGADLDNPDRHLDPIPLLERGGAVELAIRTAVSA